MRSKKIYETFERDEKRLINEINNVRAYEKRTQDKTVKISTADYLTLLEFKLGIIHKMMETMKGGGE